MLNLTGLAFANRAEKRNFAETVSELGIFLAMFSQTITYTQFERYLVTRTRLIRSKSIMAKLGYIPNYRHCLIRAARLLARSLEEPFLLFPSSPQFGARWAGIKEDVYEIIDKRFPRT